MSKRFIQSSSLTGSVKMFSPDVPAGYIPIEALADYSISLPLTNMRTDAGVGITGTATGGAFGISRTSGTSFFLAGESETASAVTDTGIISHTLPVTYDDATTITVTANASIAGAGTITAASCTLVMTAFAVSAAGAESAITVTGGTQQITAAGADLVWTLAGTGLAPGSLIVLRFVMVITSSSGANNGRLNSIRVSS